MTTVKLIEYEDACDDVREIYDDIRKLRGTDFINNFWKALANNPSQLKQIWTQLKVVMGPGSIDPLTKEMIYIAVSMTNSCEYCIRSHTAAARKKGMSNKMLKELIAVVGMANETNRLVESYQVEVDDFLK